MPDIKNGEPENRVSRRQGWCSGATRWTRTNSSLPKTSTLFLAMEDFRLARVARPFALAAGVKPSGSSDSLLLARKRPLLLPKGDHHHATINPPITVNQPTSTDPCRMPHLDDPSQTGLRRLSRSVRGE
ncbi:hypothetical protein I7I48_06579 [Histoplasma ohiense]|nr:hypothetical protein I7I48_06579 [Histoplasma ohiense (nom. inval.)]